MTRYINPHNSTRDRVNRRARVLEAEGRIQRTITIQPGEPFRREPGDIMIARTRPKDEAAPHEGAGDARWFAFRPGEP